MLEGLKVLDFSRLLPGPYATLALADLGAQVDHVEDPSGQDLLRQLPPHVGQDGALFYALNRNKRSVAIDLRSPAGSAAARRLAKHYDVVVESFRPGVMERLGLGYATLAADNPRLIYCSISGYGQTGPDRLRAGHDLNYMARAGALGMGGDAPPGSPAFPGVQVADVGGGSLWAMVGILAALFERGRTGVGRYLDVSMTEGATAFLHMHLSAALLSNARAAGLTRGQGVLNGALPGYGLYRTRDDRYLAVSALEPKFFEALCRAIGRPELSSLGLMGGKKAEPARQAITEAIASKTRDEWLAIFKEHDACVEPVWEGDEIFQDPQHQARGMVFEAFDATRNLTVKHLRTPLSPVNPKVRPPPKVGEHTREVLEAAGLSAEEIAQVTASKVG